MSQTQQNQNGQQTGGFQRVPRDKSAPVVKMADGTTLDREQTLSAIRNKNSAVIKQIVTGSFTDGGVLNRQQFAQFYQQVIESSDILSRVRRVPVDGPESEIDRIGVGEHLLRAVGEAESVTDQSVNTGKVLIDVVKTGFGWDLSREVVEDTIEYENTADIILSLFSDQYAFDLATLAFQGDVDATVPDSGDADTEPDPDPFYSQLDGWLKEATEDGAAVQDEAEGTTLNEDVLFDLSLLMPDKYIDATNPMFVAHPKQVIAYRRSLADRQTNLGDEMLTSGRIPTPTGYGLVPSNAIGTNEVMFTDMNNLVFAPHRDIRVNVTTESEKVVKNDLFAQYAMLSRIDFAVEQGEAVAIADNLAEPTPTP